MTAVGVTAWTDATLEAELADMREAVAYGVDRLQTARKAAADQYARTVRVYGSSWPASSEHAIRTLDAEAIRLEEHLAGSRAYLAELKAEMASR